MSPLTNPSQLTSTVLMYIAGLLSIKVEDIYMYVDMIVTRLRD